MKALIFLVLLILSFDALSECIIKNSNNTKATKKHDPLYLVLEQLSSCPSNIRDFRDRLINQGFTVEPTMVANRGRHNPKLGSFSFFESVSGDTLSRGSFFFGHFIDADNNILLPSNGQLVIEAIAWDAKKELFNFYELVNQGNKIRWFYRGDSLDILADNTYLYRERPINTPLFGNRMRCSACHISGGPIMKELYAPHNDWWSHKRQLIFMPNRPSREITYTINQLIDAEEFSSHIVTGINLLEKSLVYQKARHELELQELLRPLFCETEVNLQSDLSSNEQSSNLITIPSEFFVNSLLASDNFVISRSNYNILLDKFSMNFPETSHKDADHAWLTPVKGHSDYVAIRALITNNIIDENFALSSLSVDLGNPILSPQRCALLKLVPSYSADWRSQFINNLENSNLDAARILARSLAMPDPKEFAQTIAQAYVAEVKEKLKEIAGQEEFFAQLIRTRANVFASEISQNPRGQILEPGFRVIFPVPN